jgi:hypothetical protein
VTLNESIPHKLSAESRLNGAFDAWISSVSSNQNLAIEVSRTLLVHGETICDGVDPDAYRALIDAVTSVSGLGKGIFFNTMKHLPESFARVQLKMWSLQGFLPQTSPDYWQSCLFHALTHDRLRLGLDIIGQMSKQSQKHLAVQVFATLDDEIMAKIPMIWKPFSDDLVTVYCGSQSFLRAHECATTPSAKKQVMHSIAASVKFSGQPRNWADVMRHMILRSKYAGDSEELVNKHKSGATVVINEILAMDDDAIKADLNTDELRLMAFKLGLDSAVKSIQSLQMRGKAFEHSLAL